MTTFNIIVYFSALLVIVLADQVKFKDCGSKLGTISSLDITPCPQFPCPFKKSTNISVTMDFKATANVTAAKTKVYGYILGSLVPFPLPDDDACHNMACPIKNGDTLTYKNAVFVRPEYPKLQLVVQWEIMSGSDVVTCFTVPAQIVD